MWIWYVGLESPELHIARVRSRVEHRGHDIPEAKIRERYIRSRTNLIELQPYLTELKVFGDTEDGDPQNGQAPAPKLLLHQKERNTVSLCDLPYLPQWAKPIVQSAKNMAKNGGRSHLSILRLDQFGSHL